MSSSSSQKLSGLTGMTVLDYCPASDQQFTMRTTTLMSSLLPMPMVTYLAALLGFNAGAHKNLRLQYLIDEVRLVVAFVFNEEPKGVDMEMIHFIGTSGLRKVGFRHLVRC
jgi:hypothetical protein